ncbi:hypothetical protein IAE57_09500 [Stenotrophomonas sp. S48]|uniref:hypothetical protein n=1 Tax=unclassified Stenotrophomonas TaxID=196198 RepID=UPI001900E4DC|nr:MULTISPECIES: hypothetical protein [unclassified Stenotrophomonas]MBK0026400.1 hypothetical protein [Stenotrophomonas sp. S48]MBK0047078.1 hypothetical protein [Stenotrophomonas sp. S49]
MPWLNAAHRLLLPLGLHLAHVHTPVYQKALASGTHEELAELQKEFDRLSIDLDRVHSTHNSLHETRHPMAVKEASEALPGLQKKLDACFKHAEEMQKRNQRPAEPQPESTFCGFACFVPMNAQQSKVDHPRASRPTSSSGARRRQYRPDLTHTTEFSLRFRKALSNDVDRATLPSAFSRRNSFASALTRRSTTSS